MAADTLLIADPQPIVEPVIDPLPTVVEQVPVEP